ncbi:hypothetical protein ONZ45_g18769 [Pleurotus djamor]|nr:hypothetical protein ONZ45_g18769 [Pleurotus djamor]
MFTRTFNVNHQQHPHRCDDNPHPHPHHQPSSPKSIPPLLRARKLNPDVFKLLGLDRDDDIWAQPTTRGKAGPPPPPPPPPPPDAVIPKAP